MERSLASCAAVETKAVLGAGVTEQKGNLLGGEGGVDRHGGGAEEQDGKVGDGPLGAILGEDGDAVAVGDALAAERLDDAHDPAVEVGGRDCMPRRVALEEHDSGLVALHDLEENVSQGAWLGFRVHSSVPSTAVFRRAYLSKDATRWPARVSSHTGCVV